MKTKVATKNYPKAFRQGFAFFKWQRVKQLAKGAECARRHSLEFQRVRRPGYDTKQERCVHCGLPRCFHIQKTV